ncbi:AAA family ATPase [Nocardia beijingensis]
MALVGRDAELKELVALVEGPGDRAGVLIRGEAGIGKSALVAEAIAAAAISGARVLRTAGVESEQNYAYAGLHRLLYPLRKALDGLPTGQFRALTSALGLSDSGEEPTAYLVGLAALTLLTDAADERPLLLVAEDAHWLDPASAEVLAFVARRIGAEPVALIATLREGNGTPLADAGLSVMTLEPLSDDDAAALLEQTAPELPEGLRHRLLAEADGNPLALIELPTAVRDVDEFPAPPQLTERLERAFTARSATLPAATRSTLLVAALNDSDSRTETLAAASIVLGTPAEAEILAPAVETRLLADDPGGVVFRHPLVRSALIATATADERARVHRALADVSTDPERRAWRRAAAAAGPDEQVAREWRTSPNGRGTAAVPSPPWSEPPTSATTRGGGRTDCCARPKSPSIPAAVIPLSDSSRPRAHFPPHPDSGPRRPGCSADSTTGYAKALRA